VFDAATLGSRAARQVLAIWMGKVMGYRDRSVCEGARAGSAEREGDYGSSSLLELREPTVRSSDRWTREWAPVDVGRAFLAIAVSGGYCGGVRLLGRHWHGGRREG